MLVLVAALAFIPSHLAQNQGALPKLTETTTTTGKTEYEDYGKQKVTMESTVTATWSMKFVKKVQGSSNVNSWCTHECKGKVHKTHEECDASCDAPCPLKEHVLAADGLVSPGFYNGMSPLEASTISLGQHPYNGVVTASEVAIKKALEEVAKPFLKVHREVKVGHRAGPCEQVMIQCYLNCYELTAKVKMSVKVMCDGAAKEEKAEKDLDIGTIYIMDDSEIHTKDRWSTCRCKPLDKPIEVPDDIWCPIPLDVGGHGYIFNFFGQATDMQNSVLNLISQLPESTQVYIPAGTILEPEDDANQLLAVLYGGTFDLDSRDASIADFRSGAKPIEVRTACMQLHKRQPNNAKYRVRGAPDQVLSRVAALGKNDMIRGLYDQPRVWIYTDNATLEEINKVLLPRLSPGQYLRALYDDWTVGAFNPRNAKQAKCLDPDLIQGTTASPAAKTWFVTMMSSVDPKALVAAMKSNATAMSKKLTSPAEMRGMAEMIDAVAGTFSPEVLAALPEFIDRAVPESARAEVAAQSKWLSGRK
jgi:hypothetical protein